MRRSLAVLVLLSAAPAAAQDASPRTGETLAAQCAAYAAAAAQGQSAETLRADPCRAYLMGYFRTVKQAQDAELTARLQGQPAAPSVTPCFAMPTDRTVPYTELAEKVAAHAAAHPEFAPKPADEFTHAALAASYPCPAPDSPR